MSKDLSKEAQKILDAVRGHFNQTASKQTISPHSINDKNRHDGTPVLGFWWVPKVPATYRKGRLRTHCEINARPQVENEWEFYLVTWIEIGPSGVFFGGTQILSEMSVVYDLKKVAPGKCVIEICEIVDNILLSHREYTDDPGKLRTGSYFNG